MRGFFDFDRQFSDGRCQHQDEKQSDETKNQGKAELRVENR